MNHHVPLIKPYFTLIFKGSTSSREGPMMKDISRYHQHLATWHTSIRRETRVEWTWRHAPGRYWILCANRRKFEIDFAWFPEFQSESNWLAQKKNVKKLSKHFKLLMQAYKMWSASHVTTGGFSMAVFASISDRSIGCIALPNLN